MLKKLFLTSCLFATLVVSVSNAKALPFNDDMVDNPMKTGRIMRPLPPGSLSDGSSTYHVASREDALKLSNPAKADEISIANGKRLFAVNCTPCHGDIESNPYKPGTVSKFLPGPNLAMDLYKDKPDGRTDGSIYGTIHFGSISGLMPALGWKFSPTEHWDLINYIRKIQDGPR